jgi:hypothetical protein
MGKEEHFYYVREIVCDEIEKNQSYYEPYISTDFYLHVLADSDELLLVPLTRD